MVASKQPTTSLWKAVRLSCGSSCHIRLPCSIAFSYFSWRIFLHFPGKNLLQKRLSVLTAEFFQWMVSTGDAKVYDAKLPGGALWDPFGLSQVARRNDSFPHGWMVGWLSFSFASTSQVLDVVHGVYSLYIYIHIYYLTFVTPTTHACIRFADTRTFIWSYRG